MGLPIKILLLRERATRALRERNKNIVYEKPDKKHTSMKLIIVVPCYNEEAVLRDTTRSLVEVIDRLKASRTIGSGRILYVDDGSKDGTWRMIEEFSTADSRIAGLKLAHNAGHQNALMAGMEWASTHADAAITIDADLQDDVNAIYAMVEKFNNGCDIVYGVRNERSTDTFFKRNSAQMFYRIINAFGGETIYNHADFRLMSRRAIKALLAYPERNLFLRGLVVKIGLPSDSVYYSRGERMAGETKYPLRKMISFALEGITSFSTKPLRYITYLGVIFILISMAVIIYALCLYFNGMALHGWTSLLISVWFIGGTLLIAGGITGEYIGKIYTETKHRPLYLIEKITENKLGISKHPATSHLHDSHIRQITEGIIKQSATNLTQKKGQLNNIEL